MVSKSPKWGCSPSKWPNSMAYKWGAHPNYLLTGTILQVRPSFKGCANFFHVRVSNMVKYAPGIHDDACCSIATLLFFERITRQTKDNLVSGICANHICAMVKSRVLLGMGDLPPLIGILIMGPYKPLPTIGLIFPSPIVWKQWELIDPIAHIFPHGQ